MHDPITIGYGVCMAMSMAMGVVLKGRKGSVVAEENWAMAEEEVLEEAEEAATNLAFTLHLDKPLSCQVLLKSPQFLFLFLSFVLSPLFCWCCCEEVYLQNQNPQVCR